MKKALIVFFVMSIVMAAQLAYAQSSCYTCNVNRVGPDFAQLTSTTSGFTARNFSLNTNATIRNQHLAVLLTAATSGKTIIMCVNGSPVANATLTTVILRNDL